MKNLRQLAVILIFILLLTACSDASAPEAEAQSSTQASSEAVAYPALGVAEFDEYLTDRSGKPTMALFWTTWCPSCKQQVPEMEALYTAYGDQLNILTISLDENVADLEKFFAKSKATMPVYHGDQALAEKFNVSAIPTLVIFNKKGEQTFGQAGVFPKSMLQAMADKLIVQ